MTFAAAAGRAAHVAASLLHWRPPEFWAATPAELVTCLGLDGGDPAAAADTTLLTRLMEAMPDDR